MRNFIFLLLVFLLATNPILAQTGPGGVGNTTGDNSQPVNKLWFDANYLSLADLAAVASWTDRSGNGFDATQATGASQPIFRTGQINGLPAVVFDGTNDFMPFDGTQIVNSDYTVLFVGQRRTNTSMRILLAGTDAGANKNLHIYIENSADFHAHHYGNDLETPMVANTETYSSGTDVLEYGIFSTLLGSTEASNQRRNYQNNHYLGARTNTGKLISWNGAALARAAFDNAPTYHPINVAEVIIYSNALNNAQLQIVHQYLAEKYAITIENDLFTGNDAAYIYDLAGVGQASNGSHTRASSSGFYADVIADLDNDEYIMFAHNNTAAKPFNTSDLPAGVLESLSRSWYLEKTGNLDIRMAFDLNEVLSGGLYPGEISNYVLLYRSAGSGAFTEVQAADGVINGNQIYFNLTDAELADGYYTLGTLNTSESPLDGISGRTWYSLVTGNWEDPSIWTLDPSAALPNNPDNETPTTSATQLADKIVIKSGKTITVNTNNLSNAGITVDGRLDLKTTIGHSFGLIKGTGRILMSADNFPTGDANNFTSEGEGEGTVVYYGGSYTINTAYEFFDVELQLDDAANTVTLTKDLTINGDLDIKQGELKINDDFLSTKLNLFVANNLSIEATGKLSVGQGNTIGTYSIIGSVMPTSGLYHSIFHQIEVHGNFLNDGIVKLSNQTAPVYNEFTSTGAATLRFTGAKNAVATLNNTTHIYNLVIDRGIDKTYIQEIYADAAGDFVLFGPNNVGRNQSAPYSDDNPEVRKSLFIKTGTLELTGHITIPTLSEGGVNGGNGDYAVGQNARLWLASPNVSVYNTASAQSQITGYETTAVGVNTGSGVQALSLYGEFRITDGFFGTRNSAGFIFWANANSQVKIEGGTVNVSQIRAGAGAGVASYTQTGGLVLVRGNQTEPGEVSGSYPIFGFDAPSGVFNMSGGEILMRDIAVASVPVNDLTNGFYIPSAEGNYSVTGGTITIEIASGNDFEISSTAPIYNLVIKRLSGSGVSAVRQNTNIKVLNDFTLGSNTELDVMDNFDNVIYNLSVGRNFTIEDNALYQFRTNTTTLNGTEDATLYIGDITALTNPSYTDPEGANAYRLGTPILQSHNKQACG